MTPLHFILIPLLGALIGWLTNWAAIRMLFRPRRQVKFGPWKIQGVIPKRQKEIAQTISHAIETELFSHNDIRTAIQDPAFVLDCERAIYQHVNRYTETKKQSLPDVMNKVITKSGIAARFEYALVDEIAQHLPDILDDAAVALESNTDIRAIISQKLEEVEMEKLETVIKQVAHKELAMIEYIGALLGMLIGLLQVGVYIFL